MKVLYTITLLILFSTFFYTCRKDPPFYGESQYPEDIAKILVQKCATTGCHNEQSKDVTSGLSLVTWDALLRGNNSGAVVIPYSPDQSVLMFFINTYNDLGPKLIPAMPLDGTPLSREEVIRIKDWIAEGAPNSAGFVKFSDKPQRKKVYVVNQGSELVSVFDKESGLVMRYVRIGTDPVRQEAPHMIKVSPDNQHWYVVFNDGAVMQKYRTTDDKYVGQATLSLPGAAHWNSFVISDDSKSAYVVDWSGAGVVKKVNLETMKQIPSQQIDGLNYPHGSAVNKAFTTLYVTAQTGNFIYRIDVSDPFDPVIKTVPLQTGETPSFNSRYDAHEVLLSPDETKYFVTCQKSNELRIFSSANDSLLQVIHTGDFPQEMAVSVSTDYLFVSCTEDTTQLVQFRPVTGKGAVAVINYKSNSLVKHIYSGYQPHGIAVDELGRKVYVANRNQGQYSHHTTNGKSNGNMTIIDMNTLSLIPGYRPEVSVDPYTVAIRP